MSGMIGISRLRRRGPRPCWRRLVQDSRGSLTIEAVLWIPLFVFLILLVVDVSNIYLKQSEAMRIVHAGNRALSVDPLLTPLETKAAITEKLTKAVSGAKADTDIIDGYIVTTVDLPFSAMMISSSLPFIGGKMLKLTARHMVEY